MPNSFARRVTLMTSAIVFNMIVNCTVKANEDVMHKLDQNQDGVISIKESVADLNLLALFGVIDRNFDGFITKLELEQFADTASEVQVVSNK